MVAAGEDVFAIQSGNAALAKAGTGDVLTGIIVGLLSQGLLPLKAACLGAYLHGHMAESWVGRGRDYLGLLASDLLLELPREIRRVRRA